MTSSKAQTEQPQSKENSQEKIDLSVDAGEIKQLLLAIASIFAISAFWWVS